MLLTHVEPAVNQAGFFWCVFWVVFLLEGAWGCGEGTFAIERLLSKGTKALEKILLVEGKEFKMEKPKATH